MKIRKIFLCLFILLSVSGPLLSQMKKGEKLFSGYSYQQAINNYELLEVKTPEVKRRLAESYLRIGDTKKSEFYYQELVNLKTKESKDYYNYSFVLSMNGKYEMAQKWMAEYLKLEPNDSRAKKSKEDKYFYKRLLKEQNLYKIKNVSINSEHQDFGTTYYKDKIVFASSRETRSIVKRVWNWNALPFLDMYQANIDSSNQLMGIEEFEKTKNKKYHEGPVSFNKAGDFMVFTRNNYKNKSQDGVVKLQLFSSEFQNGRWQKEVSLPFNNSEYSVAHSSLTADGSTMYFASDMPGGYGGVDLYKTNRTPDGQWGKVENLGSKINTEGNEMFPFIHDDENMLFFSSNGHLGIGGLDVFVVKVKESEFGNVQNLGVPINGMKDDFSFVMDSKSQNGFFSSNREGGLGNDDIYSFVLSKPYVSTKVIEGIVIDEKGNLLPGSRVILYDKTGFVIKTIETDADATFKFEVEPDEDYVLQGSKKEYFTVEKDLVADLGKSEEKVDLVLEKDPGFSMIVKVFDLKTKEPIIGVDVVVIDQLKGNRVASTTTIGGLRILLIDIALNDSGSYHISLNKRGYFPKTVTYNVRFTEPGEHDIHSEIDLSMLPLVKDIRQMVKVNPIYFDVNKYEITADSEIELDKIVMVMNQYPKMIVELSSHTDCRARKSYNLRLSNNRAKASAEYIKSRISNPDRISGKGYGESRLLNHCECETNRIIDCSREEHQINRRTEFKIISVGDVNVQISK
jgi:outer membrane protein OmpA-like peptidoglycan-associated protein